MPNIEINENTCIQCGACVEICYARDVFETRQSVTVVVNAKLCRLCGHCVAVCPTDSIEHEKIPLADCPLIEQQQLPSMDMMINAFRARRSLRRYKNRPVSRDLIRELITQSRWIPTGNNRQYIDWIVLDDEQKITDLLLSVLRDVRRSIANGRDTSQFLGDLSLSEIDYLIEQSVNKPTRKRFFFNAPVVLAGYCDKNTVCAREEATYAAYNITLAAERIGLGTCHIGSIQLLLDEFPYVQHELLNIAADKEVQVLLTLGYPEWKFRRMLPRRMPNIKWTP